MYPNIIITNRLHPSAIINNPACASCNFNHAHNGCKRRMWGTWRGNYNPATRGSMTARKTG